MTEASGTTGAERGSAADPARLVALPFQSDGWLGAYRAAFADAARFETLEISSPHGRLLLPLAIARHGPFRVADIVGGKHASFHAPALDAGFTIDAQTLRAALVTEGKRLGIDAILLTDCPFSVDGVASPLAIFPNQPSPSFSRELALEADGEALLTRLLDRDDRKKLRQKEGKLAESFGQIRARFAETPDERASALMALHEWKSIRFGAKGINDPFASAEARQFLALGTAGEAPPIRLFTLHAGERLVALMAGAATASRFSGMANANDPDPAVMKSSPGDLLIRHLILRLAAEGIRHFDLGVGEARYKAKWCPDEVPLFDCALPITAKGWLAARAFLAGRRMKRMIKQSDAGMRLVERLRSLKAR
jgi:CelD/BcsL family acetyltransferase involved in cellulose biosynthesis